MSNSFSHLIFYTKQTQRLAKHTSNFQNDFYLTIGRVLRIAAVEMVGAQRYMQSKLVWNPRTSCVISVAVITRVSRSSKKFVFTAHYANSRTFQWMQCGACQKQRLDQMIRLMCYKYKCFVRVNMQNTTKNQLLKVVMSDCFTPSNILTYFVVCTCKHNEHLQRSSFICIEDLLRSVQPLTKTRKTFVLCSQNLRTIFVKSTAFRRTVWYLKVSQWIHIV